MPAVATASAQTVRFASIVAKAGKPTPYLAWRAPAKDPPFKSALVQHRVMTIRQQLRGPHKDAGEVGYFPERNIQLLLFPKSLRRFEGKRVVGIDYALLADQLKSTGGVAAAVLKHREDRSSKIAGPGGNAAMKRRGDARSEMEDAGVPQAESKAPEIAPTVGKLATTKIKTASEERPKTAADAAKFPRSKPGKGRSSGRKTPTTFPKQVLPKLDPIVEKQLRAALRELKAGKSVAAYERLSGLVPARGR